MEQSSEFPEFPGAMANTTSTGFNKSLVNPLIGKDVAMFSERSA